MKTNVSLTTAFLLCALGLSGPTYAGDDSKDHMEKIENHWEMLTKEENKSQRSQMIKEHKRMLDEYDKSKGMNNHHKGISGKHMHDSSDNHMHMMNTIDMHRSMMDMME